MNPKLILLLVLSIISGLGFIVAGIYFFINASNQNNSENDKINSFRYRGSGYVALSMGFITIFWAVLLYLFPSLVPALALMYMICLIIAFISLIYIYR